MAKYSIADTTLTAIADAIREKAGNSDAMTPAQMAEAIAAIQAGGGTKIESGEFTLSADANYYDVTHSLGETPKVLLCWVKTYIKVASYLSGGMGVLTDSVDENIPIHNKGTTISTHYFYPGNSNHNSITGTVSGNLSKDGAFYRANPSSFRICDAVTNSVRTDYMLKSGVTYVWVAVA